MNKPRPFNHQPIYTDARRERLQQVEQRARQELGLVEGVPLEQAILRTCNGV